MSIDILSFISSDNDGCQILPSTHKNLSFPLIFSFYYSNTTRRLQNEKPKLPLIALICGSQQLQLVSNKFPIFSFKLSKQVEIARKAWKTLKRCLIIVGVWTHHQKVFASPSSVSPIPTINGMSAGKQFSKGLFGFWNGKMIFSILIKNTRGEMMYKVERCLSTSAHFSLYSPSSAAMQCHLFSFDKTFPLFRNIHRIFFVCQERERMLYNNHNRAHMNELLPIQIGVKTCVWNFLRYNRKWRNIVFLVLDDFLHRFQADFSLSLLPYRQTYS